MKSLKFQVLARFDKVEEVVEIYRKIEERGHEIFYKWTREKSIKPYEENEELAREYIEKSISAAMNCGVLVLLSDESGTDMYGELAAAIVTNIFARIPKIYVIGEHLNRSKLFFHPKVNRRKTIEDVLKEFDSENFK